MKRWAISLLLCLAVCAGCRADKQEGESKPPEKSLAGMTVEQLGEHVKKHHGMDDHAAASVMGDSAYEIFTNPRNKKAPALVVSWTTNDEGEPAVDQFAFTRERIPTLTDEDAVVSFCEKVLRGKGK